MRPMGRKESAASTQSKPLKHALMIGFFSCLVGLVHGLQQLETGIGFFCFFCGMFIDVFFCWLLSSFFLGEDEARKREGEKWVACKMLCTSKRLHDLP